MEFQSSAALSSGCNVQVCAQELESSCFNPQPPFRAAATSFCTPSSRACAVSILSRPFERLQQSCAPLPNGLWFQSSAALSSGCNHRNRVQCPPQRILSRPFDGCNIDSRRGFQFSILSRPFERLQLEHRRARPARARQVSILSRSGCNITLIPMALFQSSAALSSGCNKMRRFATSHQSFNPQPPSRAAATADNCSHVLTSEHVSILSRPLERLQLPQCDRSPDAIVSILSRPLERLQPGNKRLPSTTAASFNPQPPSRAAATGRPGGCRYPFQSSAALSSGCNVRGCTLLPCGQFQSSAALSSGCNIRPGTASDSSSFNPQPPSRAAATDRRLLPLNSCFLGFNPQPPSRAAATVWLPTPATAGFNPQPPSRAAATLVPRDARHAVVSILSRPLERLQLVRVSSQVFRFNPQPPSRAAATKDDAAERMEKFQSSAALSSGCNLKLVSLGTRTSFNPQPPSRAAATSVCPVPCLETPAVSILSRLSSGCNPKLEAHVLPLPFQSSAALSSGCNQARYQYKPVSVSILERLQRGGDYRCFNPQPPSRAAATLPVPHKLRHPQFQSSAVSSGCNPTVAKPGVKGKGVSILSRPLERLQHTSSLRPPNTFQSSAALSSGCNDRDGVSTRHCFNPQPPSRAAATCA